MNTPAKLGEATMLAGLLRDRENGSLHPAWRNFVHYCAERRYGEMERLRFRAACPSWRR